MDRAVLVSSREDAFNEGHWGYLEARMVEVAVRAKRAPLKDNAQIPQERTLSEAQQSDAEAFFTQMRSILPVLGVQVFRETQPLPREEKSTPAEDSPVFRCVLSKWGIDARARAVGGEFIVLQGSRVTPEVTTPRRYQRVHVLHSQLVADGTIRVEGGHGEPARDIEDYRSAYLDLYQEMRQHDAADKEPINEDLVFEIELVRQVEVNVDYVLMLVEQHRASRGDGNDVEIPVEITRALKSSPSLRDKRDLIEAFYRRVSLSGDVATEFARYVAERREAELEGIIERENLRENASEFAHRALAEGFVSEEGTGLSSILPHMSRFARGGGRAEKKARVLNALRAWVSRFMNLGGR